MTENLNSERDFFYNCIDPVKVQSVLSVREHILIAIFVMCVKYNNDNY